MINFKEVIANLISKVVKVDKKEIEDFLEVPKDIANGDYAFPCFRLAKQFKKSTQIIANEIKEKLDNIEPKEKEELKRTITNIQVTGGYLNFNINKKLLVNEVLKEIENNENYGSSKLGEGKNIIVEYSSPNIAKPFHIGHLRTTLIGNSLYKVYKYLGYNTTGINHLGDYGTQFGKMIEAYKMWGTDYNLEEDPINKMMDMYVKINDLCKKDEKVLQRCRENFRLLENDDKYCVDLWNEFKNLSMKEFEKIYNILNVTFDSYNGEAFYTDKMDEVEQILEHKGKITLSQGAKIVDLTEEGIDTPCIIKKADGSTIYATRDLAAILYRSRTYDFDKCLYVVAYEQNLHFKQVFTVAKYLVDEKYVKGLKHISYGMVSLPTGKMSTRLGNVVKIEDLLNQTINKAKEIIEEKNPNLENKENVAKKVGIGAIIFNTLSTSNVKDQIFDWDTALNFQGETGPYIQYTFVRTQSVIQKAGNIPRFNEINIENLLDDSSIQVLKLIYNFEEILNDVTEKNEPSILARYLIDMSKAYSAFYNENKIICNNKEVQNARVYLTSCVGKVLKKGAELLGMEMPNKM